MKRQLCSVSRAVAKTYQVTAPNTDIGTWEQDILDIVDREQITDVIPTSEEICHVANLAPRLPETARYVGPSALWINQWHDKLQFVDYAISRGVTAPSVYTTADPEARGSLARPIAWSNRDEDAQALTSPLSHRAARRPRRPTRHCCSAK